MKKNLTILISLLFIIPIHCTSQQKEHPLFTAAREGNITEINQALNDYADCSIKDDDGNTLLHIAAAYGHENIIDALTADRGWWQRNIYGPTLPNIDEKNKKGDSPLESAIRNGKHSIIAYFHTKKELNKTDDDQIRALHACIDSDDQNSLNLLHFYDYNIFLKDNNKNNILYRAVKHNKKNSIQFLAQHKELINSRDDNLNTPLIYSMTFNQPDEETIRLLIDNGAHVNSQNNHGTAPIHLAKTATITNYLLNNKANIDIQDIQGNTALLLNIKRNNKEMVNYLIQKNADIKKCNKDGETAFMIATIYGHSDIYEMIAQHPDANINYQDHKGETALHKLSKNGLIERATLLMHKSPSLIVTPDKQGNIPSMTAIKYNQKEFIKSLITTSNLPLHITNNDDENMLELAAQLQDSTLFTLLLPYFSPEIITRQNKNGFTLVHHVAKSGGIANAHIAQRYNLAYSQRTHKGDTCVHIAAHHNNIAMLRLLKENNEDFDARNYNQETPLTKAALADSAEAVQFILSEKHYINRDVEKIIELLKKQGKKNSKVYRDLQQQHDARLSKCRKIVNEYQEINTIVTKNQSLQLSITQKNPAYFIMLSHHTSANPRYKSAEQLYILPEKEWIPLLDHYRECKDHELNHQKVLNKILNDIRIQEEQEEAEKLRRKIEEAAQRAAIAEQRAAIAEQRAAIAEQQKRELEKANMERRKQKEAAQHAAAIAEQQKRADAEHRAQEKEAARRAEQSKPDNPPQQISDHDRQVWAQKNIDLFKQNFKKEHGKKSNNNFTQKDIHELEKCIKTSTLSHTNIAAEDGEKHIHNGIILFLDKKLETIKQELHNSNKYRAHDIEVAVQKTRKDIANAVERLKQPTYEKLAELLGDNNGDKENNIMKRIINNLGIN